MRFLPFALLLAALLLASTHYNVSDPTLASYLEEAYSFYTAKGLTPAPPCSGSEYQVEIDPNAQYDAYTLPSSNRCVIKHVFKVTTSKRLAAHEVGHAFLLRYKPYDDFWVDEALPEAMAAVATNNYYFPLMYFSDKLYTVNPFSLGVGLYDWYKYSATVAWYLQNLSSWGDVLSAFSSRSGAARLYVGFLVALAKGVNVGGWQEPEREVIQMAPGPYYLYPDLDGYSAAYYKVVLPGPGYLRISVDSDKIVSNMALNREFWVDNGTVLLGLVNNSSQRLSPKVVLYFSQLRTEVVGGFYRGGVISISLRVYLGDAPAEGEVVVNGSKVPLIDGVGVFNITGELRPYILEIEYGQYASYLTLNLTQISISITPSTLYLLQGGRGYLNITLTNPNPIDVYCRLDGSGLIFRGVEAFVPRGSSAAFKLEFSVGPSIPNAAAINCDSGVAYVAVRAPSYRLLYDLDKESGLLQLDLGGDVVTHSVGRLPSNISLTYKGYTVGFLYIPAPLLSVNVTNSRPVPGGFAYTLLISVGGPPWASFEGTVYINGAPKGRYSGDHFDVDVFARPGESVVQVTLGRLSASVQLRSRIEVKPLGARVIKDKGEVLVAVSGDVDINAVDVNFGVPSRAVRRGVYIVAVPVGRAINVNYTVLVYGVAATTGSFKIYLPAPDVFISAENVRISPKNFSSTIRVFLKACNPSVEALYVVNVGDRALMVRAVPNGCVSNSTAVDVRRSWAPTIEVEVGGYNFTLHAPAPTAKARLLRWVIDGRGEYVQAEVELLGPGNYTYETPLGSFRGSAVVNVSVPAEGGVARINYGFGTLELYRPRLVMLPRPAYVEVGVDAPIEVLIESPPELHIAAALSADPPSDDEVAISGRGVAELKVPARLTPGNYSVVLRLGPYVNTTYIVWYKVNMSIEAPELVPATRAVVINVTGNVYPPVPARVAVNITGCGNRSLLLPLNSSIRLAGVVCTARIIAYSNSSRIVKEVRWASLKAALKYNQLGSVRGLPAIPPRNITAYALLGEIPVGGRTRIIGDFDKLGLVNYTVVVEYMGVVNKTEFMSVVVPPDSFRRAEKTRDLLPAGARPYFDYLVEKAALTGDWQLVDGITQLYTEDPTPFTLAARRLVEMSLEAGREPNLAVANALRLVEPLVLGVVAGGLLAAFRRFI